MPRGKKDLAEQIIPVLVQRELEFCGKGIRERIEASCRIGRGLRPRRFFAWEPIPKGRSGGACDGNRPPFGLGPWNGARVSPHRSPILRPGRVVL